MTLGEIIHKYRKEHKLSMDAFSEKSGISKSYISLIEKNKHPKTGKPIVASVQYIKQAADGMDMDFNELFSMIDGYVDLANKEEAKIDITHEAKSQNSMSGRQGYYLNEETAAIAQEIFDNKELRLLFDASKDASAEDLELARNTLLALKRKENKGEMQ